MVSILDQDSDSEAINAVSRLVEALVEHSASWMASRLGEPRIQSFLGVLLDLTGFPGLAGRDESLSEVSCLV